MTSRSLVAYAKRIDDDPADTSHRSDPGAPPPDRWPATLRDPSGAELVRRADLTIAAVADDDGRRTVPVEPDAPQAGAGQPRAGQPRADEPVDETLAVIGDLAIRRRAGPAPLRAAAAGEDLAAYECGDGSFVVATSRAYVRTEPSSSVPTLADDLSRLGLRVEHVPSYAPHTGYVSGDAGVAASRLEELRALPGVRSVEVELLRPRARRGDPAAAPASPPPGRGVPRRPPVAPSRG